MDQMTKSSLDDMSFSPRPKGGRTRKLCTSFIHSSPDVRIYIKIGFPGGSDSKESACNAGDPSDSWVRKVPWRRDWLPSPVFSPGKSHGQRSLQVIVHRVTKYWTEPSN